MQPSRLLSQLLSVALDKQPKYAALATQILHSLQGHGLKHYFDEVPWLLPEGFRMLGEGYFSACIEHRDMEDVVFKFSPNAADSYHGFAIWCMQKRRENPSAYNKHLPVIYAAVQRGDDVVYVIERLDKIREYSEDRQREIIRAFLREGYHPEENMLPDSLVNLAKEFRKEFPKAWIDLHPDNAMIRDCSTLVITDPVSEGATGDFKYFKRNAYKGEFHAA